MKARSFSVVGLLLALLGCEADEGVRSEFRDEGEACVWIGADNRLAAEVVFPKCLSSSCDRKLTAECTVKLSGGKVSITSYAESERTGASECTDDCGALTAACHSEGEVDAGRYDIEHGADATTEELGSARVCFGEKRFR